METPTIEQPVEQPITETPVEQTVETTVETPSEPTAPAETTVTETPQEPTVTEPTVVTPFTLPKEQPVDPYKDLTPEVVAERFKEADQRKALLQSFGYTEQVLNVLSLLNNPDGLNEYVRVMSVDYNNLSDEAVHELRLKEQYSAEGLSEEDVALMVEDEMQKYRLDPDLTDERDVRLAKAKLKILAQQDRKQFIERQQAYVIPKQEAAPVEQQPVEIPYEQVLQQRREQVLQNQQVQQFYQAKKLQFGDAQSPYNFEVQNPEQTLALIYDENRYIYHTSVRNEQGQVQVDGNGQPVRDWNRMAKIAAYAEHMETIEKGLIAHGEQLARRKLQDEAENVTIDKTSGAHPQQDTVFDALLRKIR